MSTAVAHRAGGDESFGGSTFYRRRVKPVTSNCESYGSQNSSTGLDFTTLKKEVAALLLDVPSHSLPLFKFREMFEKRYRRSVSSSDLYKIKDAVTITDSMNSTGPGFMGNGRRITLSPEWPIKNEENLEVFCRKHPPPPKSNLAPPLRLGWAEKEVSGILPNVEIEFSLLSQRVRILLDSHQDGFPLYSFLDCYASEFGSIRRAENGHGVPLEHLISSVHGVEICQSSEPSACKRVQWRTRNDYDPGFFQLRPELSQLSRELVDLLKTLPRSSIPFSKLIPAYHHHFGRQCRVADYGYPTLSSLLQVLPISTHVIGEGPGRVITLTHRTQMKRFASDVLRVLKSQPGIRKEIGLENFGAAFSQVFMGRIFVPEDYGLCTFTDLIYEIVDHFSTVTLITDENGQQMLSIPKREQSLQEIQKTRHFAAEVVELLSHSIRCEMQFSKFIPSYHHHFGRQCRVSDYGFAKLAELFDAISEIITTETPPLGSDINPEDKIIRLTPPEQIKVVGEQIQSLIRCRLNEGHVTHLEEFEESFLSEYGFALRVDFCGASDLRDLILNFLASWVNLDEGGFMHVAQEGGVFSGPFVSAPPGPASALAVLSDLESKLSKVTFGEDDRVEDTDGRKNKFQSFVGEITKLLEESGGVLSVQNIESTYSQKYEHSLVPSDYGYPSLLSLLLAIPSDVASLRGRFRTRRILVLNKGQWRNGINPIQSSHSNNHGFTSKPFGGLKANSNFSATGTTTTSMSGHLDHGLGNGSWANGGHSGMGLGMCVAPPLTVPQPLFSPILQPPTYARDTNIFNFDVQPPPTPTPLSQPPTSIYDMWMNESGNQNTSPLSPPILWAYPVCYSSPTSPGSPNLIIPSYSFAPWNSPRMNSNSIEHDSLQQSALHSQQ